MGRKAVTLRDGQVEAVAVAVAVARFRSDPRKTRLPCALRIFGLIADLSTYRALL